MLVFNVMVQFTYLCLILVGCIYILGVVFGFLVYVVTSFSLVIVVSTLVLLFFYYPRYDPYGRLFTVHFEIILSGVYYNIVTLIVVGWSVVHFSGSPLLMVSFWGLLVIHLDLKSELTPEFWHRVFLC